MDDIVAPGRDGDGLVADEIEVTRQQTAEGVLLRVAGELDVLTAPTFSTRLDTELTESPGPVMLDLGEVTFMSSAGIDALIKARAAGGSRLEIRALHPSVRRILELSSLLDHFDIGTGHGDTSG